jgi:hypothetical protein
LIDREQSMRSELLSDDKQGFSLMLGGPLYHLLLRIGLVRPPLDRLRWRIFAVIVLAWVPLFVLTALGGRLTGGVQIPFFHDFEVQARLLLALPLLIAGEVTIHRRVRTLLQQFLDRQIITPDVLPKFEDFLESALRLRDSMWVEAGIILFVLLPGVLWSREFHRLQSDTWYATVTSSARAGTPAGYWYVFVSLPVMQFIALRWYFRLFLWARLLWQTSKLDLNLVPTHPDGTCGLGFLDGSVFAMASFLIAHACLLSGYLANRILYEGAKLPDYKAEIGTIAVFLALLALAPLCVFTRPLLRARRLGLRNYGRLASAYVVDFDRKWIGGQRSPEESLVGTADIQSLADLANSFAVVRSINPFPFGRSSLIGLAVIIALPLLPLTLTMFSLEEIALRLLKILL